jgi:flagellar protein FlgJ
MTIADLAEMQYRSQILPPVGQNALTGTHGTGARLTDNAPIDKKSPLFAQCREFESIFVKIMIKEMRATVQKDGLMSGGWAEEVFSDMLDDEYAVSMSETASFGLAEQLYRQLAGAQAYM